MTYCFSVNIRGVSHLGIACLGWLWKFIEVNEALIVAHLKFQGDDLYLGQGRGVGKEAESHIRRARGYQGPHRAYSHIWLMWLVSSFNKS